jgi:hypothetical protein
MRFKMIRKSAIAPVCVVSVVMLTGCLIDDSGGTHGRADTGPTASVPDSGRPGRRESADETLRENEPPPTKIPDDKMLDVPPPSPAR